MIEFAKASGSSMPISAQILFRVSIRKLESAPSRVLEPISSLLKMARTFILLPRLFRKLFRAAKVQVRLSIRGLAINSSLIILGLSLLYKYKS